MLFPFSEFNSNSTFFSIQFSFFLADANQNKPEKMSFWRKSIIYVLIGIVYFLFGAKTIDGRVAGKVGGGAGNYHSGKCTCDTWHIFYLNEINQINSKCIGKTVVLWWNKALQKYTAHLCDSIANQTWRNPWYI